VSRSESRRFLLVKAVLMPITTKAFWGGWDATAVPPPLLARSTASSISRVDTALSSDLRSSPKHPTKHDPPLHEFLKRQKACSDAHACA